MREYDNKDETAMLYVSTSVLAMLMILLLKLLIFKVGLLFRPFNNNSGSCSRMEKTWSAPTNCWELENYSTTTSPELRTPSIEFPFQNEFPNVELSPIQNDMQDSVRIMHAGPERYQRLTSLRDGRKIGYI